MPDARIAFETPDAFMPPLQLQTGDLYLFHSDDVTCPSSGSLWGIVDKVADDIVYLESYSSDLSHFILWRSLPAGFRYSRRASRTELRDYMANLAWFEIVASDRPL